MEFKKKYHKYKFKYLNEKNYQKSLTFIDNSDQITKFNNKNLEKKTLTNTHLSIFKKNEYLSKYSKNANIIQYGNLFNITGGGIENEIKKLKNLDMDAIRSNIKKMSQFYEKETSGKDSINGIRVDKIIDNNIAFKEYLQLFFHYADILIRELKNNYKNDSIIETACRAFKKTIPSEADFNKLVQNIPAYFLEIKEYNYFINLFIETYLSIDKIISKISPKKTQSPVKTKITHPPSDTSSDEYEDALMGPSAAAAVWVSVPDIDEDIDDNKPYNENHDIVLRQVQKKVTKLRKFVHDELLSNVSDSSDLKLNSKVLVEMCKKKDTNNEEYAKYYDMCAKDLKEYCLKHQTADDFIEKCDDKKTADDFIEKCDEDLEKDKTVDDYIKKCNDLLDDAAYYVEKCNESKTAEDYKKECDAKKETSSRTSSPISSPISPTPSSTDDTHSSPTPPATTAIIDQSIEFRQQDNDSDASGANDDNNFVPLMNKSFYEKYLKNLKNKLNLNKSEQIQVKNLPGVKIIYK